MNLKMEKLTFEQFIAKFDKEVHDHLREKFEFADVTHLVLFENIDMSSSQLGRRSAMLVGPSYTYKTLEAVEGQHLNDLPSQRQYAVAYCSKEK